MTFIIDLSPNRTNIIRLLGGISGYTTVLRISQNYNACQLFASEAINFDNIVFISFYLYNNIYQTCIHLSMDTCINPCITYDLE